MSDGQTPAESRDPLGEMGLDVEDLHAAIRYAYRYWLDCTENDPPGMAGYSLWGKGTRGLREQLGPKGWKRNQKGQASVVNADRTVAIVVSSGDEHTGDPARTPKTKHEKGITTERAVLGNAQLEMFALRDVEKPPPKTWMLLIAVEVKGDKTVIHSELSRPAMMDEEHRVCAWFERITLPDIVDDDEATRERNRNRDDDSGDEFDVDVRRRTS